MQRTIRIQLHPSPSQAGALTETSRQFTSAFNQAVRLGWYEGICNATKLHYLVYYPVKTDHPTRRFVKSGAKWSARHPDLPKP